MSAKVSTRHSTLALVGCLTVWLGSVVVAAAATLPEGFEETVVLSGLTNPTSVRFSSDGRVFVAEKRGVIKVFDNLEDPTPDVFADLNINVYNFWDRGLLGMVLDPNFPNEPWIYVLYTYDADIDGTAPKWGTPGVYSDPCPNPPGATADGCVVGGRVSALEASGNVMIGAEQVLLEDWCQQYPSHSIGDLEFGPDGMLYVSSGDGASFNFVDHGQRGFPELNPCDDPPTGIGTQLSPPTAEGGALRSQDLRTNPSGGSLDPVTLDGTIVRVSPSGGTPTIVAHGLRNPFRMDFQPGTNRLWIGDVGWNAWEEINLVENAADGIVENFGWPCYEGSGHQSGYDGQNLDLCEDLYVDNGAHDAPYLDYHHSDRLVAGESCPTGSSSIAGLQFYDGLEYPTQYAGALFFADYSRDCIWAILAGPNGPDASQIQTFVAGAANPVDLEAGPNGDLYYVDLNGGTIRQIRFFDVNTPPVADLSADTTSGPEPLTVNFSAANSIDPDGDSLTYDWDLDGDGALGDSSGEQPSFTYQVPGEYTVTLEVSDGQETSTATVAIRVGNTPPVASIDAPVNSTTWQVGDIIEFAGAGLDLEDGALPDTALTWSIVLHHCVDNNCHTHPVQEFEGVAGGTFDAPDHEYPSWLELQLTVTDSAAATDTVSMQFDPATVALTFETKPGGFNLAVGSTDERSSFVRNVIPGSTNSISAPSPQFKGRNAWEFQSWSDGGERAHDIIAPDFDETYSAVYAK